MSSQKSSINRAFRLLDVHVSEADAHPNAIKDILFERSFEGIIIREFFSIESLREVVSRLDSDFMRPFLISLSTILKGMPYNPPETFGQGIVSSRPDLKGYFACASPFRQACSKLFENTDDFEKRMESLFHTLSNGLDVRVPTGPNEKSYTSNTIRILADGHEIPVHVGNEFLKMPQSAHLNTLVDLTGQLSFFMPLSDCDDGGELIVYRLEWNPEEGHIVPQIPHQAENFLNQFDSMIFKPGVGDLLIFDGGRFYHRVTPVLGQNKRRTIGGFLSLSKQHDAIYYWS